jgi:hypothetical protein
MSAAVWAASDLRGAEGDGDVGARLREGERDGAAQAARATGDEDRFAGERLDGDRGGLHKISLMTQGVSGVGGS